MNDVSELTLFHGLARCLRPLVARRKLADQSCLEKHALRQKACRPRLTAFTDFHINVVDEVTRYSLSPSDRSVALALRLNHCDVQVSYQCKLQTSERAQYKRAPFPTIFAMACLMRRAKTMWD